MDMSHMTMSMSTATSTGMSMATSTSSMDMDMSDSSMSMSMADMAMTFFVSFKTPLFSTEWTPGTKGQYAGTCIFIIALAVIMRVLLALKPILEGRVWTDSVHDHMPELQSHIEAGKPPQNPSGLRSSMQEVSHRWSSWRVNPAAGRATFELVTAGVAYLLMLAVMTMNVGYFMSVLAGVWLGTFMLGSIAADSRWRH
ncbi:hypothetical protein MYU51_008159 [Penicillium brevicompactum]|uniref:Copper transport protein n=1 Tax=Penicillium brevicompactum TaxID=5074 RepID=A0A9W9QHY0_PENBR|nr:uncharacterized protein N7506_010088 [Penicillium brevicompactum]KAJ5326986.1 hypothetical protein N7506_010088 [Penicillium brevicompactum]KAJ5338216.1 hypothetical protein N7452_004944 [Penicillium brevicompactum]